jgi:hypothetical protein
VHLRLLSLTAQSQAEEATAHPHLMPCYPFDRERAGKIAGDR